MCLVTQVFLYNKTVLMLLDFRCLFYVQDLNFLLDGKRKDQLWKPTISAS